MTKFSILAGFFILLNISICSAEVTERVEPNVQWKISQLENELLNNHVMSIDITDEGIQGSSITVEGKPIAFVIPGYKNVPVSINLLAKEKNVIIADNTSRHKTFNYIYLIVPLIQFTSILLILIFAIKINIKLNRVLKEKNGS